MKLIVSVKDIWIDKVPDEAEKHLHSNKFLRTEHAMSDLLNKKKNGLASGLLKIAYKEEAKRKSKNYTLNCKKYGKMRIGTINLT